MANFDEDRCRRRARVAVARDGVDATHVHFYRGHSAYREAGGGPAHGVDRTGVMSGSTSQSLSQLADRLERRIKDLKAELGTIAD